MPKGTHLRLNQLNLLKGVEVVRHTCIIGANDWDTNVASGINILTKFHKDWMKTINILTKFHKAWINTVTSTVYTNKLLTDACTHARRTPDITRSHKLTMSLRDR
ncbi:hypothetical protein DPMN_078549 [Dreissena polymorpha]|uniref:Uncharacterized protein n=1 Tax=Dreissena polymorpha TaxID=45954 RepID=A0A9D3YS21_DREPO|nr:hypothetical protein DPMN_078549 [Dreissena polymorpha]